MAEKKLTLKKFFNSIVAISAVAATAVLGFRYIAGENGGLSASTGTDVKQLEKVDNLQYNESENMFTWDEVIHADGYTIEINGKNYQVEDNQYAYVPIENVTNARVQATDSTGAYASSNWSDVYTYKIPESVMSYASVNAFVNDMLPASYQFRKIVSMHIEDDTLYTNAVFSNVQRTKDMLYELEHKYDHTLEGLADAMDEEMPSTLIRDYVDIVSYNSAKYLVESNEFVGELEEYRQQGYEVSVVSSQTVKNSSEDKGEVSFIYATYKLDSNFDTKYAQSIIRCSVQDNPSTNEQVNYTIKLSNPETRTLRENSFHLLEGDLAEFAEMMDNANNKTSTTSTSYTYDMEY